MERRLAAIMTADVVGYSRLIRADEEGTIAALKVLRAGLVDPKLAEHNGRIVKLMGDGMLAEFTSVVDAVRAAAEIQQAVAERNADQPADKRIELRVGINLGDVVIDGDDIQGDGVNVAARLEGLAQPGGICISGSVHEQVRDRVDMTFEDLGEQKIKNIDRPLRVWHWVTGVSPMTGGSATTEAALPLPDKPSIAVLPFENMSDDPEQEYFSDGIAEDIITALSKYRWFFVIARNSSFIYKGRAVDVTQVGQELGVRYVLEGSVRKAGGRVRITAQLIDANTGNHIWADRYDRELEDIFALQDEITSAITAATGVELAGAEQERATRNRPDDLGAWDLYQRGMWHLWRMGEDPLNRANEFLRQAIEADPGLAPAHAALAYVSYLFVEFGSSETPSETLVEGLGFAETAVALDEKDAFAHFALGRIHMMRGESSAAKGELERALELNQNFAPASYAMGYLLLLLDRASEAIPHLDHALRLSPGDPLGWGYELLKAGALQTMGCFDEAEELFDKTCRFPTTQFWPYAFKAALLAARDRMGEARAALAIALNRRPGLTVTIAYDALPPFDCTFKRELRENLRKAGLPG